MEITKVVIPFIRFWQYSVHLFFRGRYLNVKVSIFQIQKKEPVQGVFAGGSVSESSHSERPIHESVL